MLNIEVILVIIGVCIAVMVIGGLITILTTLARIVQFTFWIITLPVRMIARLF